MSPEPKSEKRVKKRSISASGFNSTNKFMATSIDNVLSNSKNDNAQGKVRGTRK